MPRIENPEVAAVFECYPSAIKRKLLFLRQLIFKVASKTEGVGVLEETLKWVSLVISRPNPKAAA